MKKLIAGILFCFPIVGFGQCVKCESFVEALKDPSKVTSIQMNGTTVDASFDEVPDLAIFTNLEILYLTDLALVEIPEEIGKLKNLKELSFAGNELEEVPEELFRLKQLKELILFSNSFTDEYKAELQKRVKKDLPNTKLMID
jgi:Leucine-rich repeat (LRR) protein